MTDVPFLVFRAGFITLMTLGMMASLTRFRFKRLKLLCILAAYCLWAVALSLILLLLGGELLLLRLFFFVISIPAMFLSYWAATDSPSQAVFNYVTQIMLSMLMASMVRWLTDYFGLSGFVNILLMALLYVAVIFLEWHFLRKPFHILMEVMPTRWSVLTIIPCALFGYLIFLAAWPASYLDSFQQRIYIYAAVIPIVFVYIAVFRSLVAQYRSQKELQNAALLSLQISALKEKMQKVREVEEDVRIQRHDLRHQLQTVTELVSRGDRESALDFLDAARKRLDEQAVISWCRQPVLDAVFSSYFEQARRQNIPVKANISLPETLPVDEGELAVVLANALENAINANMALPVERRELSCRALGTPTLLLEIANPCGSPVVFNDNRLPVAQNEGHGFGVQSISAFCSKYGAVCRFELADGVFKLNVVL